MVAGIAATFHAFNYIGQLRTALKDRLTSPPAKTLDDALAALVNGPAGIGAAHRDLSRRLNDQLVGDAEPTPSVVAGVDAPCKAIDAALDALRRLQGTSIAELKTSVALWTPPAPACGM
jgi:hypothetical protein